MSNASSRVVLNMRFGLALSPPLGWTRTVMNIRTIRTVALTTTIAMALPACQNLTPGENAGLFAVGAGLATAIPLAAAGVDPSITIPVSAGAAALAGVGAYVIAKHQASERQKKVAEQRARLYLAEQEAKEKAAAAQASASKKKAKKPARYIAVKTEKEDFNTGKEAVMVFDTQTNELVGNNVYDVKSTPKAGQMAKFDTYTAEYVGTGS